MKTAKFREFLTHRKEFIRIDDLTEYKRARVQLHWRGIVLRDEIEGAQIKTKDQQAARAGELLVAEIDAKVGGIGIVPPELNGAIVSSHYFLFEVDESKCLKRWLDWFVRSGSLSDQIVARGSTNYAAIRPNHVLEFEMPLPPLDEQRHIVSRIEELASKIGEAQTLRRTSSEQVRALIASALEQKLASLGATHQALKSVCVQITDGEHATPPRIPENAVPLVTAKNVRDGHLDLTCTDFVSRETAEKCWRRCKPQAEDVLMVCVGATTGRVCRLADPPEIVIVRSVALLRPNLELIEPRYLEYALESPSSQSQIWKSVKQAAQPGLYIHKMNQLSIPVPSLGTQREIVSTLDGLHAKCGDLYRLQSKTGTELDGLMPSILDKAFRGEL